ncbi:hypothetical protein FALBO_4674 [Fusarium albosuccineum]|uniref:Uncharacterized protein n=1 Tax=Fusarium albosuccineum TaxID=1237068 RepID=A0A8H4LHY4_9HYPO|nr:hypothetical protein FALBO_4674 [Fusarium albosuccineum]
MSHRRRKVARLRVVRRHAEDGGFEDQAPPPGRGVAPPEKHIVRFDLAHWAGGTTAVRAKAKAKAKTMMELELKL